jgi:hypothetical protein
MSAQSDLFREVADVVSGARNRNYGPPKVNLDWRTARLWSTYLNLVIGDEGTNISGVDVCNMMILLKIARIIEDNTVKDNYADIAGYAGAAWEIVQKGGGINA